MEFSQKFLVAQLRVDRVVYSYVRSYSVCMRSYRARCCDTVAMLRMSSRDCDTHDAYMQIC
jgi:hypothetical protein